MKRLLVTWVVLAATVSALSACGSVAEITLSGARSNVCATGDNCGVYVIITNGMSEADALVGARSEVATECGLHTVVTAADGQKQMTPVANIAVPASGSVQLKPGSFHVMLMSLKRDLREGDTFPLTLVFEKAGEQTLNVTVHAVD